MSPEEGQQTCLNLDRFWGQRGVMHRGVFAAATGVGYRGTQ